MVANVPGSVGERAAGGARARERAPAELRRQRQPRRRRDDRRATCWSRTRTRSPSRARSRRSCAFADAHPRCGIAGPLLLWPDGSWQPSRRRFPTVRGTLVRRTPLRLSARRSSASGLTTCSTSGRPSPVAGRLDARRRFLLHAPVDARASSAAGTRASATTSRTSTSATALRRPAGSAGTCRTRSSATRYAAVIDKRFLTRHTLWHLRGMARFVRKHPERLLRRFASRPEAAGSRTAPVLRARGRRRSTHRSRPGRRSARR